jgi:hypothetical protein
MRTNHKRGRVAATSAKSRETAPVAKISLVVPPDLRDRIDAQAKAERRSLNKQCEVLLERGLEAPIAAVG